MSPPIRHWGSSDGRATVFSPCALLGISGTIFFYLRLKELSRGAKKFLSFSIAPDCRVDAELFFAIPQVEASAIFRSAKAGCDADFAKL
jgi:hypothetical protein